MNIEPYTEPGSVVVVHDTIPLDDVTQRRERATDFWSGDVWKMVVSLKAYRPDLTIFTIATPPTGLTVVTNLDPASTVLRASYDEIVERHMDLPYASIADDVRAAINVTARSWSDVLAQLGSAQELADMQPEPLQQAGAKQGRVEDVTARSWSDVLVAPSWERPELADMQPEPLEQAGAQQGHVEDDDQPNADDGQRVEAAAVGVRGPSACGC